MKVQHRLGLLFAVTALAAAPACGGNENQEPNDAPNAKPDNKTNGETNKNTEPNADPNQDPNMDPNQDPNMDPNQDPNMDPNQDPNMDPNQDPNMDPNQDPNQDPNNNPNPNNVPGEVVECTETIPAAASGLCDVTAGGGANVVLRGTVLAGDKVYKNGAVIYEGGKTNGKILYVGCDYAAEASAADATVVACADGVISPGLINAHDHITYNSKGEPKGHGDERFDHRHDWRRGIRGHDAVNHNGNSTAREHVLFGELRHLMAGTTSLAGSGSASGLVRNLDRSNDNGGLAGKSVDYSTFPLGDTGGQLLSNGCDYSRIDGEDVLDNTIYLPHIAEGIDPEARNEFTCLNGEAVDLIKENTSVIHGIGLKASDIAAMAADGAKLVWSPRSNIDLYGQTADVLTYRRFGVTVALGTDWVISGSMNMLRELACADYLNTNHYNNTLSDRTLFEMATINGAVALGVDDILGSLSEDKIADIAIFDGSTNKDYRAVVGGRVSDVALVLRGGEALFGEDDVIDGLSGSAGDCDTVDVCSNSRKLCSKGDTGLDLAGIVSGAGNPSYDLFFCGTPEREPSCVPARPGEYDGMSSANDSDGDGIENDADVCPDIFDPARPLSDDMQPNFDMDDKGDACDVCPTAEGSDCPMFDPDDRDSDGTPNASDNCPGIPNMDQADQDNDGHGDVCDACPNAANPGDAGCPVTIYAINKDEVAEGAKIALSEVVVAGVGDDGFFLQVPATSAAFDGLDYSGVFVYAPGMADKPELGDVVDVDGSVGGFRGGVQLLNATFTKTSSGDAPAPVDVDAADILRTGSKGEAYEGLLVRITNATIESVDSYDGFGEVKLTSGLYIDDALFAYDKPEVGQTFTAVVGHIAYRDFSASEGNRLLVRSNADLVAGPAALDSFNTATAFIEAGQTMARPSPDLAVTLTSPADQAITVDLSYMGGLTGPATVTIAAGDSSAPILVDSPAATGAGSITASYDGDSVTVDVTIYDAATARTVTMVDPAMANIAPNGMTTLTATVDVPGTATTTLDVSTTGDLSAPTTVTLPAGSFTASIPVTATSDMGGGTVTVSFAGGTSATSNVAISTTPAGCSLIISEYVEGGSFNKAIELFNCSGGSLDLSDVNVCLVSNANTSCGGKLSLSGTLAANETYVICHSDLSDKSACDVESNSVANFSGDDRLILWEDGPASTDGDFDIMSDNLLDAFGDADTRGTNDDWKDKTLDRCDFTPYVMSGGFDYTTLYNPLPKDTLTGLGVAPTMGCP